MILRVDATCMSCHCAHHRSGPAEELPFPDGSVDLLTAASAAHWFDTERFLKEAARVLKPHGCIALLGYIDEFRLHYGSCGDKLSSICEEVRTWRTLPVKNLGVPFGQECLLIITCTTFGQKYVDTWQPYPYAFLPQTVAKKWKTHNCLDCLCVL